MAVVCAVLDSVGGVAHAAPAAPQCGPSYSNALTETPWPLRRLNPPAAWPLSRGKGVIVAVIDSGVSTTHPKLAGQVLSGKDFLNPSYVGTCDDDGHGTLVAGIIAASDANDTNGVPYYGVAPDAKILPIRVLPNSQKTDDPSLSSRIAQAIVWATDHGAKVINMSLITPPTQQLADAVTYAESKDVVLVAAAGNEGGTAYGNSMLYPAGYPGVVAVAGVDQNGKHVSSSNTGTNIAVSAPGVYNEGPAPQGGGYGVYANGGTSFAAAYVSGVAALVRAYNPSWNATTVVQRIEVTADPPPDQDDPEFGSGVVNPYRALSAVLDSTGHGIAAEAKLPPPAPEADPLAGVKRAALWITLLGAVLAACLLLAAVLTRRQGQSSAAIPAQRRALPRDEFTPLVGQQLVVSAPAVRRGGSPAGTGGGQFI
jgi:type VII secretion-associated serine protease mycosin